MGSNSVARTPKKLCTSKRNYWIKDIEISNNTGTTHYDSLQGSDWADQRDSCNEVIMTSLQGQ